MSFPPEYQLLQFKIGFNLGWEFPYSPGVEFSFLFSELVDINFGFGFGSSGAKGGVGARVYPIRTKKISPMAGLFYYRASGMGEWQITQGDETAVYEITRDRALLINAGFRYRFGKGHYFTTAVGYSFPFAGDKAKYVSGSTNPEIKNTMDIFCTGGFSIDVGLQVKLNKGSYRK